MTYDRWTIYPANILLSEPVLQTFWLTLSALLVWRFPTVQEWSHRQGPELETAWSHRRGVLLALLFFVALLASMQQTARTFVYSQF
jgi:alginate O-acetyltransferase complex protein AlgI